MVNVGTGVQTSLRDVVAMIGGGPPSFVAERPGELGRFCVSPVRARIHLGWAPWTTLREGLAALRPDTSAIGVRRRASPAQRRAAAAAQSPAASTSPTGTMTARMPAASTAGQLASTGSITSTAAIGA